MTTIDAGTGLKDFWAKLPPEAEGDLLDLRAGRSPAAYRLAGIGQVEIWLDACSEGADRGGYVRYARLCEISGPHGPVVLEEDPGAGRWLFEGRNSRL